MNETDVIIIGAGVAGLAAAAALRWAGRSCVVLEAAPRIGGRAHTIALGAHPFDLGATWLHDADRNPLVDLALAAGEELPDADAPRRRVWAIGGRLADAADEAAHAAAAAAFDAACHARAQQEPDVSVAEAIDHLRGDPWMAAVETWEAAQIAAADPRRFSVRDWSANDLGGRNLWPPRGLGDLVCRHLAPPAGVVRLATPARRVAWGGDRVAVETPAGTLRAASCLVTVSTGVLATGAIRFDPPLPPDTAAAIAGLPMGLLTKVGLRMTGAGRLGLPYNTVLRRRIERTLEPVMSFHAWPMAADHIAGFVGGPTAWDLAHAGAGATIAFARSQLAALLGPQATEGIVEAVVSPWAADAHHLGAYAYALPGQAGARAVLGTPLAGGRLVFAGEATCTDGLAGTVGGAYRAGAAAAMRLA